MEKKIVGQKEAEFRSLDFLDRLVEKAGDWERYPGVGVGSDMRFELDKMAGFELIIQRTADSFHGFTRCLSKQEDNDATTKRHPQTINGDAPRRQSGQPATTCPSRRGPIG